MNSYLIELMLGDAMAEISHPPHLKPSFESSSAFIPFCAFQSNMALSDHLKYIDDIVYPVCSSFQPTILEGQLCYKLQVNSTGAEGKKNQLMLLLDYNEDRSIYAPQKTKWMQYIQGGIAKKINSKILTLNMDGAADIQRKEAKVHINTLSSFRGFGSGTYKISDVKKMTNDFLNMALEDRKCEVMPFEECRNQKLLEECNCDPLAIIRNLVRFNKIIIFNNSSEYLSRIMQIVTQRHGSASKKTSAKTSKTSVALLIARESMLMSSWHCLGKRKKGRMRKKSQYS